MQLFYHQDIVEEAQQIIFPREESKHIVKVLRKKEGDILYVTNGKGFLFISELTLITAQQCIAKVIEVKKEDKPKYYLHMAVAPTKMNDRYEWFLEKATEIGVMEITPIICDHSERKVVKLDRFERVLQSAMKQSLHFTMPKLNQPVRFSEFVTDTPEGSKFIAHCEDEIDKKSLQNCLELNDRSIILIGPEGDFSSEEIELAMQNDWKPISLGNTRLRTETAAIVACHTVALLNED
ncbi:16S rRNA (uracil1498-N3)-methyltransferase [Gillisia mitskevichiae]|uniref:Ribosomal RNA small subunit methyltransferase E n=1 Tax=Gillisia mitskevichiae TaxID=270921 RepID=A0A495PUJ5_9FLAO|nr:16S rRNA (uracil(1498)-N(3))-methyltransferase [Gillisia mitskevichiae]RKS53138.1 16S rRNA (uracil1498-N3)-methyltransferase [Gillisia mitskevichiae]